jgi:hypothetical protein
MSDDPTAVVADNPAADPAETSSAPIEPTPSQADSRQFKAKLDQEIDDLWAQAEGRAPADPTPEPAVDDETPAQRETRARNERGQFVKADPAPAAAAAEPVEPVAEATAPPADQATLEQQAYEKAKADFERQQEADRTARERIEAEQRFEQEVGYYAGFPNDRQAVLDALEANDLGNPSLLDALDVTLPNGKKVSEVRPDGSKGLTPEEARNLTIAWRNADKYGDALAGRKLQSLIGYWDQQTQTALQHPDVDAAKVRAFRTPGEQMQAAIETSVASAEKRKDAEIAAIRASTDAEIKRLSDRVDSLVNERGNLTSQRQAASAATPDRPGAPGTLRSSLPTPEEIEAMSPDEFFKSGAGDRLLQSIPGGLSRRTG